MFWSRAEHGLTLVMKLTPDQSQKKQSPDMDHAETVGSYSFEEQAELLIRQLQSVFSNQGLLSSTFRRDSLHQTDDDSMAPQDLTTPQEFHYHLDSWDMPTRRRSLHQTDDYSIEDQELTRPREYFDRSDSWEHDLNQTDDDSIEDPELTESPRESFYRLDSWEHSPQQTYYDSDIIKLVHTTRGAIAEINDNIVFYDYRTRECKLYHKYSSRIKKYRRELENNRDVQHVYRYRNHVKEIREFYFGY